MASSGSSVQSRPAPRRRAASARAEKELFGKETPRIFTPPLRKLTPKTTLGFALIEFAAEVLGIPMLPWQKWLAIHALELLPDGTFRFRTIVLLVARQNGKSTFLQILALFFMYVRGVGLVIGTAQNLDVAEEIWQGALDIAKDVDELAAEIAKVSLVNGKKSFSLEGGERYKVQAANRRGGRGLSGDLVILDELREHQTWAAWGAVTKTTLAREYAQIWTASNAGDAQSVVLASLRAGCLAALAGDDGDGDESTGIFEWSAEDGCQLNDPQQIAQANPSLGYTITMRAILSALSTDPEAVFRTECLCQWVDKLVPAVIDAQVWALRERVREDDADDTRQAPIAWSLEVPIGRGSAVIGSCWWVDGIPHGEVAAADSGTGWVLGWLKRNADGFGGSTVALDMGTEAASFVPELEAAGFTIVKVTGTDRSQACGVLYDAVIGEAFTHDGDLDLADAVGCAVWKDTGEGARAFSRRLSSGSIARLYAVTLALFALMQHIPASVSVFSPADLYGDDEDEDDE